MLNFKFLFFRRRNTNLNQGFGETETKSVSVFVLQCLEMYNAMHFWFKSAIVYFSFLSPILFLTCTHTCIHYLACEVFIYLANALLYGTFWLFPWTILLQEINVFFKWFISFSINLGTKIKLTFAENKGAVELENIYSEIKICVYFELSFCCKTNITDPQKKRSPLLTHSHIDWWCCLGRAASEMAIREQTDSFVQ